MKVINKYFAKNCNLINIFSKSFTGPTETGYKFTTPLMRMKNIKPIFPPPGLNLNIPPDWTTKKFFEKIGGDCYSFSENFPSVKEIFDNSNTVYLKKKELPIKQRKYLLRCINLMRRGLLTFEYLESRKHTEPVRKLTRPQVKKAKKVEDKDKGGEKKAPEKK